MEELNSGLPKTNPSRDREKDLYPGPPDYKYSALSLGHASFPLNSKQRAYHFRSSGDFPPAKRPSFLETCKLKFSYSHDHRYDGHLSFIVV